MKKLFGIIVLGLLLSSKVYALNVKLDCNFLTRTNSAGDFISEVFIDVKGENAHPIYLWAKENHGNSAIPKWNFHKILINKQGKIEETYSSFTKPMSDKVIKRLEEIL